MLGQRFAEVPGCWRGWGFRVLGASAEKIPLTPDLVLKLKEPAMCYHSLPSPSPTAAGMSCPTCWTCTSSSPAPSRPRRCRACRPQRQLPAAWRRMPRCTAPSRRWGSWAAGRRGCASSHLSAHGKHAHVLACAARVSPPEAQPPFQLLCLPSPPCPRPQAALDDAIEHVRSVLEASADLEVQQRSVANAFKLYLKTRPPAAPESVHRAKSLPKVRRGCGSWGGGMGELAGGRVCAWHVCM